MNRLSSEVTEKLDQERPLPITMLHPLAVCLRCLMDQTLLRDIRFISGVSRRSWFGRRKSVSVARYAYDGVEVLDGKIYFVGGDNGSGPKNIAERYDPVTNTWKHFLQCLLLMEHGIACSFKR